MKLRSILILAILLALLTLAIGQTLPTTAPIATTQMITANGYGIGDSTNIQNAVNSGVTTIVLSGNIEWDHQVEIEHAVTIVATGSTVTRQHNPADYGDRLLFTNNGVAGLKIIGGKWDGSQAFAASGGCPIILHSVSAPVTGADFGGMTLVNLRQWQAPTRGCRLHDSTFQSCAILVENDDNLSSDTFVGQAPAGFNECVAQNCNGCILHNIEWDHTTRGVILRNVVNPIWDHLWFYGICGGNNEGELIAVENTGAVGLNGLTGGTIDTVTAEGCDGAVVEDWLTNITGTIFTHIVQRGGEGIYLNGTDAAKFADVELEGVMCLRLGPNAAAGNAFSGLSIINPRIGQCNERVQANFSLTPPPQAIIGAGTNYFTNLNVEGLPGGWLIGVGGK